MLENNFSQEQPEHTEQAYELNKINFTSNVAISNQLIETPYFLTLLEHRLIKYIASLVQPGDKDFKLYKISAATLNDLFNWTRSKSLYQYIRDLTIGLNKKIILLEKDGRYIHTTWINAAMFDRGCLYIQLSPFLKPYLLNLNKDNPFTKVSYQVVYALESPHSIRIYELLKQYQKLGKRSFTIEDFKILLGIKDKYRQYANLKQKVILPTQKEFGENTMIDIIFDFKEIKEGKKVFKLEFVIFTKDKLDQVVDIAIEKAVNTKPINTLAEINSILITEGLSPVLENRKTKNFIKELQLFTNDELKKLIRNVKKTPNIKDYTAFLIANKDSLKTLMDKKPLKNSEYEIYIPPPMFLEIEKDKLPD